MGVGEAIPVPVCSVLVHVLSDPASAGRAVHVLDIRFRIAFSGFRIGIVLLSSRTPRTCTSTCTVPRPARAELVSEYDYLSVANVISSQLHSVQMLQKSSSLALRFPGGAHLFVPALSHHFGNLRLQQGRHGRALTDTVPRRQYPAQ